MKKSLLSLAVITLCISSLEATSIKNVVEQTISNNPDISSKTINDKAFRKYVDEAKGGYYPTVDLTASFGKEKEDIDYNDSSTTDTDETSTGSTIQLDAEQLIYDGNLTSGEINQAKANYKSNQLRNALESENIIYNSIKSYLDVLKFDQRMSNSKNLVSIYEDYLTIAKDTEEISGEVLDKVQTNAKIRYSNNTYLSESLNKKISLSSFKKNVNVNLDSNICKPQLDETKIPSSLKTVIDSSLLTNYSILEQLSNISEQKAILTQSDSSFLPTLKFKLQGVYSDDLLNDASNTEQYSAKLELKYNIFNGGKDSSSSAREELFVKEAQKRLDVVTSSVVDEITVAYETYNTSKKQISELTHYIEDNKKILSIYKDQFEGGTRTFIDVLNIEGDIYNAEISLINAEFTMYDSYYKLLNNQSILQKTVLSSSDQTCSSVKKAAPVMKKAMAKKEDMNLESLQKSLEIKETTSSSSLESYYVLYIESYNHLEKAEKALEIVNMKIDNSLSSKVVINDNGTFTTVLYNVSSLDEITSAKGTLNSKHPNSYYVKKIVK